jgi:outer membrane protein assembly factor BamD (BamD/ComL family)
MRNLIYFLITNIVILGFTACTSSKEKQLKFIQENEQKLLSTATQNIQNNTTANELTKAYEQYAINNLDDKHSAEFLFKSAEIHTALKQYNEAIANYQTIQDKFKQFDKVEESLFLQAFVYENYLQNTVKAKDLYREFIQKYPSHELVDDAQASINFIDKGLTPDEIVKQFEAKRTP